MPRVLNKHLDGVPEGAVYVGRPTKWGNPFVIGRDGTRAEVIALYANHLEQSRLLDEIDELRGRDLVCWCAPEACHADVLLQEANRDVEPLEDTFLDDDIEYSIAGDRCGMLAQTPQRAEIQDLLDSALPARESRHD